VAERRTFVGQSQLRRKILFGILSFFRIINESGLYHFGNTSATISATAPPPPTFERGSIWLK
jgi:hypothetical protein